MNASPVCRQVVKCRLGAHRLQPMSKSVGLARHQPRHCQHPGVTPENDRTSTPIIDTCHPASMHLKVEGDTEGGGAAGVRRLQLAVQLPHAGQLLPGELCRRVVWHASRPPQRGMVPVVVRVDIQQLPAKATACSAVWHFRQVWRQEDGKQVSTSCCRMCRKRFHKEGTCRASLPRLSGPEPAAAAP